MNVTDESVETAINYLASTDIKHAKAKAELNALKDLTKTVLGFAFLEADGTVEQKKAIAHTNDDYIAHIKKIEALEVDYQVMSNKRERAKLTIELWRSVNANRRASNI